MDISPEIEIRKQFHELSTVYSDLVLSQDVPGRWVMRGDLRFSATFEAITIEDAFAVLLLLPRDYPSSPPNIQETGGRIPRNFHTHFDGSLCLGAPLAVRLAFLRNPKLLPFVNNQVIPFLFSFNYWQTYGKMPFGELSHGITGILEYYQDLFHVNDHRQILGLLKILADNNYRGHHSCPCGSGLNLRRCHGTQLRDLMLAQPAEQFFKEMVSILSNLPREEFKTLIDTLPKGLLIKKDKKIVHQTASGTGKPTTVTNLAAVRKWQPDIWKMVLYLCLTQAFLIS